MGRTKPPVVLLDPPAFARHRIRLELPLPPTVNRHVRVNWKSQTIHQGGGHSKFKTLVKKQLEANPVLAFPPGMWLSVTVKVYFDSLRRDVDGIPKALFDSMEGKCYHNDRQVRRLLIDSPYLDPERPRVMVLIEPYELATGRPWVRTVALFRALLTGTVARLLPPRDSST